VTVAVVGAGLAGAAAALALAEAGLEVEQVAAAPGATALSAGTLDVACASPGIPTLPWRDALRGRPLLPRERLALHRRGAPSHPYAQLFGAGEEPALPEREIEAGIARLAAWLAPEGLALVGSLEANRLLPTVPGTLRVADFAFAPAAAADLLGAKELAVVDVPGLEAFDARALARTLAREIEVLGLPKLPVSVVHPELPEGLLAEPSPARVAARLDGEEARGALARAVAGLGAEGRVLLFPPVLGISESPALVAALEAASGARVAEALAFPPFALAGFRLQRALDAALASAGVRRTSARVQRLAAGERDTLRLTLDASEARSEATRGLASREPSGDESLDADAVVLATGRFASGGLGSAPELVAEPLLGLPLYDADGRRIDGSPARRIARKGYGNEQPLFSAGVRTDRRLRPLAANGRPQHARLFAAGDLLGGFDPARERTGLGVALVSGLRAARSLAEALRMPPSRSGDMP
jgi:glycerol-3-phosphate dehydrogenase subunit B